MSAYYLILCFVLKYCLCTTIYRDGNVHYLKKTGGFLFSMPRILISGRNETVCLSLHDAVVPAKTIVDFKWRERHFPTIRNLDSEHSCFDLYVPDVDITEPYYVSIRVQVQLNGSVESSHNQDPIIVYPTQLIKTFITTDREIYKPGDKVKFRIVALDEHLLPQNSKIPVIKIRNPLDITVAVWENVTPENGLVILEYQMVPESLTGKWKIESATETKIFEVFKYVLPRFQISLHYPRLIYYKTDFLNITVCGQYSYGRPVKGLAFIKVTDSHNNMAAVHQMVEMQNGCGEFSVSSGELMLSKIKEKFPMYDPRMHVHITATVTEKGTNRIDLATGKSLVFLKPYTLKIIANSMFQPGLPYKGKIKLNNLQVNLTDEVIEICYNLAIKKSWNYLNKEQCSNFTVNGDNAVDFSLLPLRSNVIHIHFNVRSLNHTDIGDSFMAVRLYSPSGSYIYLKQHVLEKPPDECRAPQQFGVYYTTDRLNANETIIFYYMIKSQNRIYKLRKINHVVRKHSQDLFNDLTNIVGNKHKFTKTSTLIDSFIVKFRLDKRIRIKYQLLVYYITSSGETVAITRNVEVPPCLLKVDAKWVQKQMVPGSTATLNIKSAAHSLCSISTVDKATKFLPGIHPKFDASFLFNSFSEERDYPVSSRRSCIMPTRKLSHVTSIPSNSENGPVELNGDSLWDLRRRKRHVYSFSEDYDSYDVINNFGTVVITNLRVVTKPCYSGPLLKDNNPVQFLTGQYEDQNEEKAVTMRSHFPETWLWELVPVSGHLQLKRHLPHSITSWLTNVLCISEHEGIGFSPETELKSFQSFFVEIITPYSVKRSEMFHLLIHVNNYLGYRFPVRLTLRLSDGLELDNSAQDLSTSFCLSENDTMTYTFHVKGTKTGPVNATVLAESDHQYPEECGPEAIVYQRDIYLKKFQVEPEGYPMIVTKSVLLCTSDTHTSNNISWRIEKHKEAVPGTENVYLMLNADLLGNTIENLEELLDVPSGCGEQVIASIAPNLYVLKYLNATGTLKPSTRHRIIRHLKVGYQRILNYAHRDGSFSAFGYHDPSGSMFLTAFVLRTLQEAKKYIYVDQRVIDKASSWIFDHQLENGCFNTMLHVFQDMGGTSKENSTASLTAYVIISMLEANIELPKTIQTNAKYCIRGQHNPDKYTLAISCYALFKVGWYNEARKVLSRLMEVSTQQQNMVWWTNKENCSVATDIEITSYVLLSLLHENTTENLAYAHSVVRWLTSKYGHNGGFKSTQDTVVALDALTKYFRLVRSRNLNITINVESKKQKQRVTFEEGDRMKSERIPLENGTDEVKIVVDGEGCTLVQIVHSYYLMQIPKSEAFKLAVDVEPVSNIDQCSIRSVSPCLAYVGPDGPANMAVMEVTLPSGYQADRASLYSLVDSESTSRVKMFEELANKVNLYFTKLDKQLTCFSFNINEHALVESRKDSVVKLYDYYRPEYEILQFYSINNKCNFNDSVVIPEILSGKPLSTTIKLNNVTIELPQNNTVATQVSDHESQDIEGNIIKRSTDYLVTNPEEKNNSATGLNEEFVDKNIDMEFSNCNGNIPIYVSPQKSTKRSTENHQEDANINTNKTAKKIDYESEPDNKSTDTFTNPDFVDIDTDMDFSNCSGNVPYYTTKDIPENIGYQQTNTETEQKNENDNRKIVLKRNTNKDIIDDNVKGISKCNANVSYNIKKDVKLDTSKENI